MWPRWKKSFARSCLRNFPAPRFSFEPGDLVNQIMNFGAPTPVEVAVIGPNLSASRAYTDRLRNEMSKIADLRDLKYELPLDYPSVDVKVDRELAGQLGVTAEPGGPIAFRGDLFEPFHHPELLGRSEYGHRLSSAGAIPAAEILRRCRMFKIFR